MAQAATDLVPLIEDDAVVSAIERAAQYITQHVQRGDVIDGVILGCTHYSLLADELRAQFPTIRFLAQTEIIPNKLQRYLAAHTELEIQLGRGGTFETFFTGKRHS
jgi:glutamate racemase